MTGASAVGSQRRKALWSGVDRLVDRSDGLVGLRAHRLEAWAAYRLAARGRRLPDDVADARSRAVVADSLALMLLARVRESLDGPLILLKGLEIAALYPHPWLRPAIDIDVLVPDVAVAQDALADAGFRPFSPLGDYTDHRHEQPLWLPGIPLAVELHRNPGWPAWIDQPTAEELFAVAIPSQVPVEGIATLPADYHALVVALHSWQHAPLRDVRDLLDLCLLADEGGSASCAALARRVGAERLWRTSVRAAEAVLLDHPPGVATRTWARHLRAPRRRSVGEWYLTRAISPFWAMPPLAATRAVGRTATERLRPTERESRRQRLTSLADSLRHPRRPGRR